MLAQAGEGSVRDSLSALDQAIACCGNTLEAKQVRELLGMFSLESLGEVTQALRRRRCQGDARRGRRAGGQRPQPAAFRARAGSLFPQSSGGADRGRHDASGRRIAAGAGAHARGRQAVHRRRSDAGSEAGAGSVPGFAELAAAAAASGDGIAAADSCGTVAADRGSNCGAGRIGETQPRPLRRLLRRNLRLPCIGSARQQFATDGDFRTR